MNTAVRIVMHHGCVSSVLILLQGLYEQGFYTYYMHTSILASQIIFTSLIVTFVLNLVINTGMYSTDVKLPTYNFAFFQQLTSCLVFFHAFMYRAEVSTLHSSHS